MKTFKQFLLEDPQRGKTIVFYHRTGLGGQSGSHHHMKKENIEDHVDSFLETGFVIGQGEMYGPGIYGFYTEDSMLGREGGGYGNIVLKTKVNTDKILITVPEVAKKVYGRDITLEEQFKILKLKYPSEKMIDWEKKYNRNANVGLSIVEYYDRYKITKMIKGLVYRGGHDLEAMVVYDPKLLTIISYNTTINDSTKLDGTWINVLNKNKKQIKTALTQRLVSLSSPEKTLDEIQFLKNLKQYVGKNYDTMSEKQKLKLDSRIVDYVKSDGTLIRYIISAGIKPSEAVQLAAVENFGGAISYIIHAEYEPSEAVQLAAVKGYGRAISYIINGGYEPSEAVQLAAVKQTSRAITSIIKAGIKPSEAVQLAVVKKHGVVIEDIMEAGIEPSEKVISAAIEGGWYLPPKEFYDKLSPENKKRIEDNQVDVVKQDWSEILYIIDAGYELSERAQIAAVENNIRVIKYIIDAGIANDPDYDLSEKVQLAAVKNGWEAIIDIIKAGYEPSEKVISAAVDSGWSYPPKEFYDKSSKELKEKIEKNQLAAVGKNWIVILSIIKAGYELSGDVQRAAVKKSWGAITFIENVKDYVIKYMIDTYTKSEISNVLSKKFKSIETKQKLQAAFDKKYI